MASALVFEDTFEVGAVDPDGKKFDKGACGFARAVGNDGRVFSLLATHPPPTPLNPVSRIVCRSDLYEMDLTLDVNVDVYPLAKGDRFSLALSPTLALGGGATDTAYGAALQGGAATLADNYDYVCYGKVFKLTDNGGGGGGAGAGGGGPRADVYASFGGLLMKLGGDAAKLKALGVGSTVFLMVRRV